MKHLRSAVLVFAVAFALLFGFFAKQTVSAEEYYPRYSEPGSENWYYFSSANPFWWAGYGMPNCTAYAYGRVYEILGSQPALSTGNAGAWWYENMYCGWYPYGSTPQVGAVACWDHWDQDSGHVAVVEEVYGDGTVLVSESGWNSFMFRTRVMNASGTEDYMSDYHFLGYIYPTAGISREYEIVSEGGRPSVQPAYSWTEVFSPRATVRFGHSGSAVRELQQYLVDFGYLADRPDGYFGSDTSEALQAFQVRNGISVDGVAGEETWNLLDSGRVLAAWEEVSIPQEPEPVQEEPEPIQEEIVVTEEVPGKLLRSGSKGNDVLLLQKMLLNHGYDCGEPDGMYGDCTCRAVVLFQQNNGLDVDGIAGPQTWNCLNEDPLPGPGIEEAYAPDPETQEEQHEMNPEEQPSPEGASEGSSENTTGTEPESQEQTSSEESQAQPEQSSGMLHLGDSGDEVLKLQNALLDKGYNCGTPDGHYGEYTFRALVLFQAQWGLDADGVVGAQTWSMLLS